MIHRRAFLGGSLALALTPVLSRALGAAAQEATPAPAKPAPSLPVTVTDSTGTQVTVSDISRIIPLNGDFAEVLWALGLGDNVVAVDVSATYPPAARQLPKIGYMLQLSSEAILQFNPTVVLGNDFVEPKSAIDQIRSAGVPVLIIKTDDTSIDTPAAKIRTIAADLGIKDAGEALAATVQREIDEARALVANVTDKPRVLFLLFRGQQYQLVGGAGTPVDAIVPAAGGVNAGAEAGIQGYQPITSEALLAAAPDIIILQQAGYQSIGGEAGLLQVPGVAQTPAGQHKRFYAYDDQLLLGLGPRTGQLLKQLVADFHPGLVPASPVASPAASPSA